MLKQKPGLGVRFLLSLKDRYLCNLSANWVKTSASVCPALWVKENVMFSASFQVGNQSNADFAGNTMVTKFSYLFLPLQLLNSILGFGVQFCFSGELKKTTEVQMLMYQDRNTGRLGGMPHKGLSIEDI